jgi:hypothetical protein
MRCVSCDKLLTNYESTRKSKTTGEYLDLCSTCLSSVMEVVPIIFSYKSDVLEKESENATDI